MNPIIKFLKLVEIQTKVASMLPFLLGTIYAFFRFQHFEVYHALLMFTSLLCFDMTTTAINNLYDYIKAQRRKGYGYEEHNAVVKYKMNPIGVFVLIVVMFLTAVGAGVLLFLETGWVVLILGFLSFGVGILYSFGPIPISRLPLGELFSGFFMGFVITFVSVYIHTEGNQLAAIAFENGMIQVQVNLMETLLLLLVSVPAIMGIANIMLANNVCDMEEDLANKRYTLPSFIGKSNALLLFRIIYFVALIDLPVLYFLGVPPILLPLLLLTLIPIHRNATSFSKNPVKAQTFALAVKNFVISTSSRIAVMCIAVIATLLM